MIKQVSLVVLSIQVVLIFYPAHLVAQDVSDQTDTFFLSKSKGLLGKLGKSISISLPGVDPVKTANPYLVHTGKTIRFIAIQSLGFERNIYDTAKVKNTIGVVIANAFHKNTREKIIANNLFFKEGSKINPYVVADNERHLRDQVFIQDARILVVSVPGSSDSADVIVITKDVFSIGGNISISGLDRAQVGLKEANVGGSGSQIGVSTYYGRDRNPNFGYGAEMIKRNIKGSFINWTIGFQNYKSAFNSGRHEESYLYTHFEKPLVSLYIPWVGAMDLSYSKTKNLYLKDSLYQSDFKYGYYIADAWIGLNLGNKKLLSANSEHRVMKFIAIRGLAQHFNQLPQKNEVIYDYRYADISGLLASFSIFKQDFYRTNFIYGFGRNEDVPEGFSASLIGGWTDKDKRTRSYFGIDAQRSHFSKKGFYSSYTLRFGGYLYKNRWEDVDLLFGIEHFTKLRKMGRKWYNRYFYGGSFTQQMRPVLNQPLFLRSIFGLPYYDNYTIAADSRATLKGEAVFYNMTKFWGFRMAPFIFGDMCVVRPIFQPTSQSELYGAYGAGVRTRNENLIFGTIELRAYIFPRPIGVMKGYKIELTTSVRFKYISTFIRKPDFVIPN